ncbi:hypothetical protein RIVERRIDER_88 [Xanthomonas phage RiverRider]|uniref:Uncharacterized protein n=1 Tax=Xanthomonas phage RiverRider TaxID=2108116 RepID=A0A2P1JUY1_9CAUD|nr:hypothetical protein HWB58_gp47 [Xanthomonas phage RiverRider]AVO23169.1 hypothetical protein RIVERRIDER_88 [Xanthomonas phage RiverRider]
MRNHLDPYGGLNPLVDRLLGPKAYEVVRFVASRMGFIEKVAADSWRRIPLVGKMSGTATQLLFPPLVQLDGIVESTIWLKDPVTGNRCNSESGYFTVTYMAQGARIVLNNNAPVSLQTADILWFLTAVEVINVPVA